MKSKILVSLLVLATITAYAEQNAVTIVVNSENTMTQGMAMVLANKMVEQGANLSILLCDKAGDMALKEDTGKSLKPMNATPAQLLDSVIKKGGKAAVCALYLPNSGYKLESLKESIKPAAPDAMAKQMLDPTRKVIGF